MSSTVEPTSHTWRGSTWPFSSRRGVTVTLMPSTSLSATSTRVGACRRRSSLPLRDSDVAAGREAVDHERAFRVGRRRRRRRRPNERISTSAAGAPCSSTTTPRIDGAPPTRISTSLTCSATPSPTSVGSSPRALRPSRARASTRRAQAGDAESAVGVRRHVARRALAEQHRGRVAAALRRAPRHRIVRALVAHDAFDHAAGHELRSRPSRPPASTST